MSMDGDSTDEVESPRWVASPSYALGRLRRAMDTALSHDDPGVRRSAEEKALAWEAVLSGMASGTLAVGSRTPVADTPAWVTLEVVHGGFATGRYVAEGPLADDERRLLDQVLVGPSEATDRLRLNTWFLSDAGLEQLTATMRSGQYDIEVPEHAALPIVAWLVDNGHGAAALDLASTIYPLFDRLRFYPVAKEQPPASGAVVRLRTVGQVAEQLSATTVPDQIAAMRETIGVWHPLYDRLTTLWLQTVEDDWPCLAWPADWAEQRRQWLDDYDRAARDHIRSGEHRRPRSNFATMHTALILCESDSSSLTGRDVGRLRVALKASTARWGQPASQRRIAVRRAQQEETERPTHRDLAAVVVERLADLPSDAGIGQLDPVLDAVTIDSSDKSATDLPLSLVRKVERALEAPIEDLVGRGIIPSSEVLAQVLPQISSHVASAAFADPALRELYAKVYAAFRRRRSLLLLNLEHQVKIEELPWVAALESFQASTATGRIRAADTLRHAALLALTSFPQTILPNPLVREMTALAEQADVEIPFVEEVAADIFMGTFTAKWRRAASVASTLMSGTLYASYYSLPDPSAWAPLPDSHGLVERVKLRWGKNTADDFAALCTDRAREAGDGDGSYVARNGAILEQSQILTTHNLAPLVHPLGLADRIQPRAQDLATTTFDWIVRQQNTRFDHWRSQLQMVKNTAYAWRQAIFFLSFLGAADQRAAIDDLRTLMAGRPDEWQQRFEPAVSGLESVIDGASFDAVGRLAQGRRFLGWSIGPHWLSPPATPEQAPHSSAPST